MAQHRRRRWGVTGRGGKPLCTAAATLTLAGAPFGAAGTAAAAPEPTAAEVREQVGDLHHEAELATEAYNEATERAGAAEAELDRLRDQAARRTEALNDARDELGSQARADYRAAGLPASVQLALASDPDEYLARAAAVDRAGTRRADRVAALNNEVIALDRLRARAEEQAGALADAQADADEQRAVIEDRLAEAEDLLATLTEEERARALGTAGDDGRSARADGRTTLAGPAGSEAAPGTRAAAAVAFAHAQLGKPYGWGATGPDAFDCSGLTQAAWRAAGVSLPRTSYSQAGAGTRVGRDQLAPGDLVFYYSGLSHVGIYVGGGQIIHAARTGTPVQYAPVDSMPFAAAVRPA
ncbi:C40 family peptidase [Streptomyces sp. RFCAC02]|uniref:C40 family peptidase n=1 Tax=Streptomyces sp. RFCAC02 TaxID=2499143 RepID=UPI0010228D8E|nr:C40 family peptidase [Streptomyces sp. RFCAC02]